LNPNRIRRYLFRGSDKEIICGIEVGTLLDSEIVFDKVEKALGLIESYDAKRFAQVQRDIKTIFIFGDPTAHGYWHQELQMCELQREFVHNQNTSIAQIASAIVHEATHARLMRLGFGYEEPKRLRIERICFGAEQAFARRLPDGEELVKEVEESQAYYGEAHFSDAGRREADLEGLRMLGVPKWIVWLLAKLFSYRTRTNLNQDN
jgi:hypothetical protein